LGISRAELIARYETASGRSLHDLDYWMAFNAWRSAAISEGVYRRYIDGAMGAAPPEVIRYAEAVDASVRSGLLSARLTDPA